MLPLPSAKTAIFRDGTPFLLPPSGKNAIFPDGAVSLAPPSGKKAKKPDGGIKKGEYKREHNVAILQAGRWESLLASMEERAEALGISREAIRAIMTAIHDESVRVQKL